METPTPLQGSDQKAKARLLDDDEIDAMIASLEDEDQEDEETDDVDDRPE